MDPQQPRFGGGATATILHPFVLIAIIVASIAILVLPRKRVVVPILVTAFLVPLGQQFYIAGVHLFVLRILVLVGLLRSLLSKNNDGSRLAGGWNTIDTAFACWILIEACAVTLQYDPSAALVNQVGFVWDFLGGYLLLRLLVHDEGDIYTTIKCFAWLSVLLAAAMVIEQYKQANVFGMLGGVRLVPEVREGRVRSQAVFQHSLMAGAFAGPLVSLFCLLWKNGKAKVLAVVGIVGVSIMTVTTQTSTSLITYMAGIAALMVWPIRKKMRTVRLGIVAMLVALDIVMKAPIWFLIARVDLTGSSSSYHRAALIDQFIKHFSSWWLIGTKDVANWGWDMWDAQNQFVSVGEAGGLLALIFLILVISRSFGRLGDAMKMTDDPKQQWFLWFMGSCLFAHLVAFFGVNYFDQVKIAWFALLAMISAYTSVVLNAKKTASGQLDDKPKENREEEYSSAFDSEQESVSYSFLQQSRP